LKRPRSYEKDENRGNRFGGSKAPRTPVSVEEEYIVTIEEMGKEGTGVAKLRGVSSLSTMRISDIGLWLELRR
jgi:hypothetical protein